ncbi:MAG: hypothetical protein KAT14_08405 [Candidatus Marinimicrobia bacterium]|nr:hypothetical protein [Candidatus Neomarinimicrobiota bacterium]
MKFKDFEKAIVLPLDKLQEDLGEEFLELMVDTIILRNHENHVLQTLNGYEYNLSRSRHWDKEQENYYMHDGFSDEHLTELYDDIMIKYPLSASIILNLEGMNDLDEPIHQQIDVELDKINE